MNEGDGLWEPVLDGRLRERAIRTALDLSAGLTRRSWDDAGPALGSGAAGAALLETYIARAGLDDQASDRAVALVEHSLATAFRDSPGISLYGGLAGVGWVLAHLAGTVIDVGEDDPGELIDEALERVLDGAVWAGGYDLVGGLVGVGVYALERFPSQAAARCLELVVHRLADKAEWIGGGVSWFTPAVELVGGPEAALFPDGYYNVGVAHGVPGVVGLLGRVCAAGVAQPVARELLDGAVEWVLDQRLAAGSGSAFPFCTGPGIEPSPARTAWCYGDPGVAAALLLAARAVGRSEWEDAAVATARGAVGVPVDQTGVTDAGLCHGAAGLAHIYARLAHETGDPEMAEAAREWFERVFGYLPPEEAGFLEGAVGVGLALLGGATAVEPAWDRVMLLSAGSVGASPPRQASG